MLEDNYVYSSTVDLPFKEYKISIPKYPLLIIKNANNEEMIKVASDGFYVRGIKIKQNRIEAKIVYKAFKKLLEGRGLLEK